MAIAKYLEGKMLLIENGLHLNATLRALLTLKFDVSPPETMYAGSPYIAQVLNDLWDAMIETEREKACFGNVWRLEQSRAVESRRLVLDAVADHIAQSADWWQRADDLQKRDYVRVLLAPYTASDTTMESIIERAGSSA